jgi:hypothetical protein
VRGSMKAWQECVGSRAGKDRVYISLYDEMMSIYPGVSQIYTPRRSVHLRSPCISIRPHVTQSISVIPVSLYAPYRLPPATVTGGGGEKRIFPPQRPPNASLNSLSASPGAPPISVRNGSGRAGPDVFRPGLRAYIKPSRRPLARAFQERSLDGPVAFAG